MSRLSNAIISIFRKGEKRISSEQFEQAVNEVIPALRKMNAENYWCLIPITNVGQCLVVNSDIGNVPNENNNACAEAFVFEQLFYKTAE